MTSYSFITPDVVRGTTTSWLPVTTAYPSLPGCASKFFQFPGQPVVAWDPGYGYFAGATLSCLPGPQTTWWEQEHQNPDGFTSLSIQPIVCPVAFTTAATEVRDVTSTQVMCCPSGYDLQGGQPGRVIGECYSTLTSGQVLAYTAPDSNNEYVSSTSTFLSSTIIRGIHMKGWNVDRAQTTSAFTSPSLPTPTPASTSGSSPSSSSSSSSGGISPPAKIGVAVGATIVVIALIIVAFLCIRRRRHRSRVPAFQEYGAPAHASFRESKTSGSEYVPSRQQYLFYKQGGSIYEVPASSGVPAHTSQLVELGDR